LRRAKDLKRHLSAAIAGEDIGVHQARVATRRLREAVPVLASGLKHSKAGKARRKIRRLTRALGTVRELDVTLHLIGELTQQGKLPRTALEEVRRHVIQERDKRRSVMLERLDTVDADKLGKRLNSVATALDESTDEGWRKVLATRLLKRAKRLRESVAQAGQMYEAERLHDVRIAAKKLRYAVELAADSGVRSAAPLVPKLKRVQDLLGRLHDMQVLQAHIATVQAGAAVGRPGMHEGLEQMAAFVESECRHLHARYLANVTAIEEVCAAVASRVLPDTARPRGRRPLKMTLARRRAPVRAASGAR
jgi:CHAD domain-containing protein